MPSRPSPRTAALVVSATLVAALTACAPTAAEPGSTASATSYSTTVPSDPVTLTIAYCDRHPVEDLYEGFKVKYPNVTINPQYQECSNFSTDVVNQLTGANPPDIVEYVDAAIQTTAPAGAVLDLAPYVELYGWDTKFPTSQLQQLQLSSNGRVHGEGSQYGIPGGASFVGAFYNKDLMTRAGIAAVPATIADFQASLEQAKAAGVTPIALGAQDDGGIHLWGALASSLMGAQAAQDWVNGKQGATIAVDGAIQAAQYVADWANAGYFSPSPNGVSENDARADFSRGSALYTIDGSWSMSTLQMADPAGEQFGFIHFPVNQAGDGATGQGFTAGFAISSKSPHADIAAAFLDYLASPEAAEITVNIGMLPVNTDPAVAPAPKTFTATGLRDGYNAALAANGIVTFFDHASPTMHTTMTQGLQGVISGQLAPSDFIAQLQADWEAYHTS
ncbi:MAG: extracellular solute-binding protein [Propionibacteriaceae bacterium]|jgi:raffinose/stachyose/melibiose transport system substrate-binding protein|nr:extracellular solute-binding protein [Propionibacteriaceae bacterium]